MVSSISISLGIRLALGATQTQPFFFFFWIAGLFERVALARKNTQSVYRVWNEMRWTRDHIRAVHATMVPSK
jgi:hypothetical protein